MELRPILTIVNDFDEWSSRSLSWSINDSKRNNQKAMAVVIDSYGGEAYSLLGMIDQLENCGLDVITIASAKAMSCGAILLATGKKRYATPNATIMIHAVWSRMAGNVGTLKNELNESNRLNEKIFSLLDQRTNKPAGWWAKKLEDNNNNDLFLTPEQALEYGLITDIGTPNITDFFDINENEIFQNKNDFSDLKLLLAHHSKNNSIKTDKGGIMDLNRVLNKLSEDEKKPITELQNELNTMKAQVETNKNQLSAKEQELKQLKTDYEEKLTAQAKKADEDFISGLILAGKLAPADKVDELEILNSLPSAQKEKQKTRLMARPKIVSGEIPDMGEGNFEAPNAMKAKIEAIAKKNNLDLKSLNDLQKAQEILALEGGI